MGVLSDLSYSIRSGIFFSFPVICKDKQCEIIKVWDHSFKCVRRNLLLIVDYKNILCKLQKKYF